MNTRGYSFSRKMIFQNNKWKLYVSVKHTRFPNQRFHNANPHDLWNLQQRKDITFFMKFNLKNNFSLFARTSAFHCELRNLIYCNWMRFVFHEEMLNWVEIVTDRFYFPRRTTTALVIMICRNRCTLMAKIYLNSQPMI